MGRLKRLTLYPYHPGTTEKKSTKPVTYGDTVLNVVLVNEAYGNQQAITKKGGFLVVLQSFGGRLLKVV